MKEYLYKGKKVLNKTLEILGEIANLLDKGLYSISFEKLKRESTYMSGDPRRYQNNFQSLQLRGYIRIDRKSDSVELTTKGRIKLLENSTDRDSDGRWRFLSWDIPENLKTKRNQFRKSIKRIGYKQVQKSLWASPFIVADQIDLIIDDLAISKYVAYIVSEKSNINNFLINLFRVELNSNK
jgi:hypothetical protein